MQRCSLPCRNSVGFLAQKSRDFDRLYMLGGTGVEAPSGKKSPSGNSYLLLTFLMLLMINITILSAMKIIAHKYKEIYLPGFGLKALCG